MRDTVGLLAMLACAVAGWLPVHRAPVIAVAEREPPVTLPAMPFVHVNPDGGWIISASPYLTGLAQC